VFPSLGESFPEDPGIERRVGGLSQVLGGCSERDSTGSGGDAPQVEFRRRHLTTVMEFRTERCADMPAIIVEERPDTADAAGLIEELDAHLAPIYAQKSRHGYSVEKLLREGVAFFVARVGGVPAGCGGVLLVGTEYGEIKRMYVRPEFRGLGIGKLMLAHLADHARQRGANVLRLETGIHQKEAISLYERFGFARIRPFGPYRDDPVSLCFEKRLG
jgi:GNAT superfamily N-acetyltransferase